MRALANENEQQLRSLGAFAGKRAVDQFSNSPLRPKPWTLYGRVGVLNFQNSLESARGGPDITLRRTGPTLTGRVYIGIHREF